MAGIVSEETEVGGSFEEISGMQQRCESREALAVWRSSEQVENGIPSTSPPYWDTDDDDYFGRKSSELYGNYTWKIDNFSQINKRELRSNAFEVGGYKWYILIYPQGCDVCNHLSLFLCVSNHDKLLPGWSHFAQFTIAVVNKDPKKSKYSDTLHRFWKKEHDWGWKKFMELSKVLDGFIDADTLIIKAQVQVIRERADRPFRCLDCQYRRELVRVYLSNVEQICRRFVEERRSKLGKLIEDKVRWTSFCAFWLGIDQKARCQMSREKSDAILRVIVKNFFIEKEVTSTLVMDSLYSGLRSLEGQNKSRKGGGMSLDAEELPIPLVHIEKDMFVLVDDVLLLLERAAMEPLPPKDDKGPQNRTKDGGSGEDFNKDSIDHDEKRLTQMGRRTIEIFTLAHIFSKIEVAYQEAVALKRQEELIREEEAAWLAEAEQRAKRGAAEREKKSKKKQGKQKRNSRKGKDKGRDEKPGLAIENKFQQRSAPDEIKDLIEEAEPGFEKPDRVEDISDASDSLDCVTEDRDDSPVNWDTETSEVHPPVVVSSSGAGSLQALQNGKMERLSPSLVDDSSSTCSTDSVPSILMNGHYRGDLQVNLKSQRSPSRSNQRGKAVSNATGWTNEVRGQSAEPATDMTQPKDPSGSCKVESETEAVPQFLWDRVKWANQQAVKKEEEEVSSRQRKPSSKDQVDVERLSEEKATELPSPPSNPSRNLPSAPPLKSGPKCNAATDSVSIRKPSYLDSPQFADRAAPAKSKADLHIAGTPRSTEKPSLQQVPVISRPLSTPIMPGPRPTAPVVSMVQTAPLLSHSVSAAGRLGPDSSPASQSYGPQSYRNAIIGGSASASLVGFHQPLSPSSALMPAPVFLQKSSERFESNSVRPNLSFGIGNHQAMQNGPQWMDLSPSDSSRVDDIHRFDFYKPEQSRSLDPFAADVPACLSGRQTHGVSADDFPHLDIINDLLDDEYGVKVARASTGFQSFSNGHFNLNRQLSFSGFSGDTGPSTSTCRFERTRSFHGDGFHRRYGSYGGQLESLRDMVPLANQNSWPCGNGQIDALVPNQWQKGGSDLSFIGMMNMEADGLPYRVPEYSNLACGGNGYTIFRPSNGQ